jgi:hypothetical protein
MLVREREGDLVEGRRKENFNAREKGREPQC